MPSHLEEVFHDVLFFDEFYFELVEVRGAEFVVFLEKVFMVSFVEVVQMLVSLLEVEIWGELFIGHEILSFLIEEVFIF